MTDVLTHQQIDIVYIFLNSNLSIGVCTPLKFISYKVHVVNEYFLISNGHVWLVQEE